MARNGDLVPLPVSYEEREGAFHFGSETLIVAPPGLFPEAEVLAGWLSSVGGIGKVTVVQKRGAEDAGPTGRDGAIHLGLFPEVREGAPEAYELTVSPGGIEIRAAASAGIARGAASLWQLALSQGAAVGATVVRDEPRFAWRGLMLDCARNFFRVEFIEKLLDAAALHKLNVFHWHLTDDQAWRLEILSRPELTGRGAFRQDLRYRIAWEKGGFYSREDVARIVKYAEARHILVVPEIESPGHSTALLASHPEFSCLGGQDASVHFEPEDRYGIFEDILCGGNDRVLSFFDEVLDEVCAMFPGDYVHMGGDEAPKGRWLACPDCQRKMRVLGLIKDDGRYEPEGLQAWFMGELARMLARRGKRMIGWDEVVEGCIGKDTLVMSWRGYENGRRAAELGHDVVMCPQTKACYLDHKHLDSPEEPGHLGVCTLEDSYLFEPLPEGLSVGAAGHIIGGQANLWSELLYFGRQAEYMLFPRLCALSEALWSPRQKRSFEDFSARLETHKRRLDALDIAWCRSKGV
jgi:hexosaminidase